MQFVVWGLCVVLHSKALVQQFIVIARGCSLLYRSREMLTADTQRNVRIDAPWSR